LLGLKLREEFRGRRLKGTAIELVNEKKTGATQISAEEFLEITYPTADVLKAIEAIGPTQGRPLVLIGDRGQGKSHLLGALFHAFHDPDVTSRWLRGWSERLSDPRLASFPLRRGMQIIAGSLHKQQHRFLWDLLFEKHAEGGYIRGKWEGRGDKKTDVPPEDLLLELFEKKPTALLLDEFQTWFDGLTNTKQYPWKVWAFNFVQILSEIAERRPELLVLIVSVRDGTTDAYQQIHRVNPSRVDFKGPYAERDRRRLLLHRLFENRRQVHREDILALTATYVTEWFRLMGIPQDDQDRKREEVTEGWPFSPQLLQLLEDQVLIATEAQETRDLIRILADLYKSRGESAPILTAADFRLEDDESGIAALLDSVTNEHHRTLREKAKRNLLAVREAIPTHTQETPHLDEIVGALWLRSLSAGNIAGADARTLHLDITRDGVVDDNLFGAELAKIVDNSFNIHAIGEPWEYLVFREDENPYAKLMAYARNDRLFSDESDKRQLAKEVRYVLGGADDTPKAFRIIVLPPGWLTDPWGPLEEGERPDRWDARTPLFVLPEDPEKRDETLGRWLKEHVPRRRNSVRFLLPRDSSENLYRDTPLILLARAIVKALEWTAQNPQYTRCKGKYQGELRGLLRQRFDRFAILDTWSFTDPAQTKFHVETLAVQGERVPAAIEEATARDLFVPEDFEALVLDAARQNQTLGKLLRDLEEPRPHGRPCIPWLGETPMTERVFRLCARGLIALNLRGMDFLQVNPGESEESAWHRMKARMVSGRHLDETQVLVPQGVPGAAGGGGGARPWASPRPGTDGREPGGEQTPPPRQEDSNLPPRSPFEPPPASAVVTHASVPTSALNLMAKVEAWGIRPASSLREVTLRLRSANGEQLEKLLRNLPDGLTYELSVEEERQG
jgi:hypothetical protein